MAAANIAYDCPSSTLKQCLERRKPNNAPHSGSTPVLQRFRQLVSATFEKEMKPDRTTRNWHKAIIADAERIVERTLTNTEMSFITSRGGFIALEMIHDTIKAGTKENIVQYLNSEAAGRSVR